MVLPQTKLPRREREIMDALYQSGEATVNEVIERMPDPPSYSAVRATLRVLEDKGLVKHKQDGPRYVYLPAIPTQKAGFAALKHLVHTFFDGSAEQALVALVQMSDANLTPAELERLSDRIGKAKKEGR
ncbi:MAG TPA: BlaI/MecI/CopY family transcriptional regulator [Gemmatimonadaceae bacterium]|jgi:predicted transcriptional regulator|nr:BlaI/MecI/CopY family transcriptional regulator [Gemmatimonadaceae bacterium]HJU69717.1 BlaI/MecI/CopY family transcriptional regulator [Gemmatimonadaceae bacterium]